MATPNYGLEEINKSTDILSPDPINRNMVKIDEQMKTNEYAISTLSSEVAAIDVTADVEEVVNRRVNSDRTKSLNVIIGEWKDVIVNAINSARDNIKAHVTSEHTNTKSTVNSSIISSRDSVNSTVNSARDNVNSTLGAKLDEVKQSVVSGKQSVVNAINGKLGYVSGLTTNSTFSDYSWWITNKIDVINMDKLACIFASLGLNHTSNPGYGWLAWNGLMFRGFNSRGTTPIAVNVGDYLFDFDYSDATYSRYTITTDATTVTVQSSGLWEEPSVLPTGKLQHFRVRRCTSAGTVTSYDSGTVIMFTQVVKTRL